MQELLRVVLLVSLLSVAARGAEIAIEAPIVSLGLFKNGLAVVTRSFTVPAPGEYRLDAALEPVHGTFWVESTAVVQTRVTGREIGVPARPASEGRFAEELAGREVVLYLQGEGIPPVSGRIASPGPDAASAAWDRAYESPDRGYLSASRWQRDPPPGAGRPYLAVDTEAGRTYVSSALIAKLEVRGAVQTVRQRRPALIFAVQELKTKPATVTISYLSKGFGWAPSYRLDITDPARLVLRQNAVIRNELAAVSGAEVFLISGYPSVEFGHVSSPLALQTTWASFFSQLSQRPSAGRGGAAMMTQQMVISNSAMPAVDAELGAIPTGEGVDLHYQPVGRLSLAEGEALALDVAQAEAPYERLVEWLVPDTRDADGRRLQEHQRNQDPERYEDAAWDSVRFRNPLSFPLTTAPAMIVAASRFNGQRLCGWTNVGEETTLHITKALSLRTRHTEQEEPAARDTLYIGSREYRRVKVKGELLANNHRNEAVTLVIRRRFSGDLLESAGNPKSTLLEEGTYAVNRRQELVWTLPLGPGKEQSLAYSYQVLVPN